MNGSWGIIEVEKGTMLMMNCTLHRMMVLSWGYLILGYCGGGSVSGGVSLGVQKLQP